MKQSKNFYKILMVVLLALSFAILGTVFIVMFG